MKLTETQKITYGALLIAVAVVCTLVAKLIPTGSLPYLRISLTPGVIIFSSLFLGPIYGLAVGVCSDLIPAFVFPTGPYNFYVTIVYMLLGILPWLLMQLTKRFRSKLRAPWIFYGLLLAVFLSLIGIFYGTDLLDSAFGNAVVWGKLVILLIVLLLDGGLIVGLYHLDKTYQKNLLELSFRPSPNEIAFISLLSEFFLMDLLKSLAFCLYLVTLGGSSDAAFSWIFVSTILGSPANLFLSCFTVNLLYYLSELLIKNRS